MARRNGIFMANLQYESEIAHTQRWTEQARNKGVLTQQALHFPGSVSRFWWPDPAGALHEFRLRGNALTPGETTLEEWEDAMAYERTKRAAQEHARVEVALKNIERQKSINDQAIAKTGAADAAYVGKPLQSREARALENMSPSDRPPDSVPAIEPDRTPINASYDAMMDQVFKELKDPGAEQ